MSIMNFIFMILFYSVSLKNRNYFFKYIFIDYEITEFSYSEFAKKNEFLKNFYD